MQSDEGVIAEADNKLTKEQMDSIISSLRVAKAIHEANKKLLSRTYGIKYDEFGNIKWLRNKPCFCESKKKFKHCHGKEQR
jgi:uncharacterized protein YecA (UPF0149 family)